MQNQPADTRRELMGNIYIYFQVFLPLRKICVTKELLASWHNFGFLVIPLIIEKMM